jgi:DNA-binding transcriptional LysR family regulator
MNFTSIEYFLMLEHERSFSRAAEKLNITQQTLSGHIAGVEKELGCRLFVRHVPLELTYAGEVFLEHARRIHRDDTDLRQTMLEIQQEQRGRLTIGIASTRGRAILPDIIAAYQKSRPHISIVIRETDNEVASELVHTGEVDLAIANFEEDTGDPLVLTDFYTEELILLMQPDLYAAQFPSRYFDSRCIHLKDNHEFALFDGCPLLLNPEGDISGRFARRLFRMNGMSTEIRVESSNIETLLELCLRGAGACITPANLAEAVFTKEQMEHMVQVHFAEGAKYKIRFASLRERSRWKMLRDFIKTAQTTYESVHQ